MGFPWQAEELVAIVAITACQCVCAQHHDTKAKLAISLRFDVKYQNAPIFLQCKGENDCGHASHLHALYIMNFAVKMPAAPQSTPIPSRRIANELVSPPLQMPLRALQAPACGSLLLLRAVFFSEILDLAGIELMVGAMGSCICLYVGEWEKGESIS
ncbi:hypothetical protein D5086_030715 [Populus alba]|uniref:Uncharacterized protein n=1 Tax=Populus alba TaxID=43335 RepID=A0ACC4AP99_POPAL